jgi:hypothetical protein
LSETCAGLSPKEAGHSRKEDSGYEDLHPVITALLNSIKGRSEVEVKLEGSVEKFSNGKGHWLFSVAKGREQGQAGRARDCPHKSINSANFSNQRAVGESNYFKMNITESLVLQRDRSLLTGDYKTYHAQTSRRIHALRKRLGVATPRGRKFTPKEAVTAEDVAKNVESVDHKPTRSSC